MAPSLFICLFRTRILVLLGLLAATSGCQTTPTVPERPGKPDVLFIIVDDLNDWISLLDPEAPIKTPNLQRLSGLSEFEIVARVSISGQPTAQSGDWYGQVTVRPSENREVSIVIDSAVP